MRENPSLPCLPACMHATWPPPPNLHILLSAPWLWRLRFHPIGSGLASHSLPSYIYQSIVRWPPEGLEIGFAKVRDPDELTETCLAGQLAAAIGRWIFSSDAANEDELHERQPRRCNRVIAALSVQLLSIGSSEEMAELTVSETVRSTRNVLGQPERLLKRQQGEAEREQKRKEKEATDGKRLAALQKQATLMENFLRSKREPSDGERPEQGLGRIRQFPRQELDLEVSTRMEQELSGCQEAGVEDILSSHVKAWKELCKQRQYRKIQRWGGRRQPKVTIYELRLGRSGDSTQGAQLQIKSTNLHLMEAKDSFWDLEGGVQRSDMESESELLSSTCSLSQKAGMVSCMQMHSHIKRRKLLQFDKCYRPAYYGTFSQKSGMVRPCKPFARDSTLDYQIDSDAEWKEDDPGESLSDCDKDEEDIVDAQDEDDITGGFVVPDGYLSETEGVHLEGIEFECQEALVSNLLTEDTSSKIVGSYHRTEDLVLYEKKVKVLELVTEQALRSNRACIIDNFGPSKICKMINRTESLCLQALKVCMFTPNISIEPLLEDVYHEELPMDIQQCKWQKNIKELMTDSALLEMIDILLSSTQGLEKTIDLVLMKIPNLSRTQLRKSVREICEFAHKRWQVKREVLEELGLRIPSAKVGRDATVGQLKPITKFFSKRCLPPAAQVPREE